MKLEGTDICVATRELTLAVNAALVLERPLLIKGAPDSAVEASAQQRRQVLWQNTNPVPPWEFRHHKKGNKRSEQHLP